MKTSFTLLLIAFIVLTTNAQTIIPDGTNINTTWTIDGSPYIIEGKAFVLQNDELVIEAGVEVLFAASNSIETTDFTYSTLNVGMLHIQGTLKVNGERENLVVFSRNGDEGNWGVILFDETSTDDCIINNAIIEYAATVKTAVGSNDMPGAVSFYNCNGKIRNSQIINNGRNFGSYNLGCGIVSYNAVPKIQNNIISNNLEYGIWSLSDYGANTSPIVTGNLIKNNKHGIDIVISDPFLTNNTIVNNTVCGMSAIMGTVSIKNCIFKGNTTSINASSSTISSSNSLYEESALPTGVSDAGNNILATDPLFEDEITFALTESSACVDAGTTDTTGLYLLSTDLLGNDRISNGIIDMGAIEYQESIGLTASTDFLNITIYPNPASNWISIKTDYQTLSWKLLNIEGQLIKEQKQNNPKTIDVSFLSKGLYILEINTDKGKQSKKIQIK
jgi:parallel beta-helix repeat protein